jgi:hypothetical protein
VTEAVVDVLEAVEIDEDDREFRVLTTRLIDRLLQALAQQVAVGQARERVVIA